MPAGMPTDAHGMGGIRGLTGGVVYAGDDGCPVTFQDDLPSSMWAGRSAEWGQHVTDEEYGQRPA